MPQVDVLYFATARDFIGRSNERVQLPEHIRNALIPPVAGG
jgi:molybdopterin converting factor small subunit